MADETYFVASLEDTKAKELGQIISNEKARAILNLLARKNAIQTEIAKELKIPLSTVDYNIKQLMKSGLVTIKGFYYSKKGNKINVYSLAKKFILIAPKGVSIKGSKIKSILLTALITLGTAVIIKLFFMRQTMSIATEKAAESAESGVIPVTEIAKAQVPATISLVSSNYALFFLAGALVALSIYLLLNWRKR